MEWQTVFKLLVCIGERIQREEGARSRDAEICNKRSSICTPHPFLEGLENPVLMIINKTKVGLSKSVTWGERDTKLALCGGCERRSTMFHSRGV